MKTIFIGGFAESKPSLRHVATFLEEFTKGQVEVFTFAEAMKRPAEILKISRDAQVITHSSGCLLLKHKLQARRVIAISPSQPITKRRLFVRAGKKTFAHMLRLFAMPLKLLPVAAVLASNGLELLRHPVGNFRHLLSGEISAFEIADTIHDHKDIVIVIALDDEMFRLEEHAIADVDAKHLTTLSLKMAHDEIFIHPRKTLAELPLLKG